MSYYCLIFLNKNYFYFFLFCTFRCNFVEQPSTIPLMSSSSGAAHAGLLDKKIELECVKIKVFKLISLK